jgi:predicted AlkP superfamily pyrophosphatase or phosphodiesterase
MIQRIVFGAWGLLLALTFGIPIVLQQPPTPARASLAEHVLLVGIDGLGSEGIRQSETPALRDLMANGAYTLGARAVIPTVSSPNWASMLMAAGPEQHGITTNKWEPYQHDVAPVATGLGTMFPTIVGEVRRARRDARIGVFHDWDGFGRLVERDAATMVVDLDGPQKTVDRVLAWFGEGRPTLTIVHLDHVDHAGHDHGWGSPEYVAAVREADRLVRTLVDALRHRGLADGTAIIVSADHGGVGTKHGGLSRAEIEIPWIAAGSGIVKGHELQQPVTTFDTAATIAQLLHVPLHPAWIGHPVHEALKTR